MVGAATAKLREPKHVRTRGTDKFGSVIKACTPAGTQLLDSQTFALH